MTLRRIAIFAVLLSTLSAAGDDLKIVTRRSSAYGEASTTIEYLTASKSRLETGTRIDNIARHRIVHIVHYGDSTNQSFLLDMDAQEYAVLETDKRGIAVNAHSTLGTLTGGTLDIWFETTDTGERREMFGQTAKHIITKERRVPGPGSCSQASESETDGWYIDYSAFPEWRRPQDGQVAVGTAFSGGCRDKIQVHYSGLRPGFPLRVTTTSHYHPKSGQVIDSTSTSEVVEFSSSRLDPTLFAIPADFRLVSELTYMNRGRK